MGRKPDYKLLLQHVTHIEPLFIEYAEHWLADKRPDWAEAVAEIEGRINDRHLENALRGRDRRAASRVRRSRRALLRAGSRTPDRRRLRLTTRASAFAENSPDPDPSEAATDMLA